MPRLAVASALLLTLATATLGQEPARAKPYLEAFQAERAEAAKAGVDLTAADELADRAKAALAAGDAQAAVRLARDARWLVPGPTAPKPAHVAYILAGDRRHGDRVNAVAYTPDSTRLVTASRDNTVRVWDTGNGREVRVYRGHKAAPEGAAERTDVFRVAAVAVSPDGQRVASAGGGEVHVWTLATGQLIRAIPAAGATLRGLAFGPKLADHGETVVAAGDDKRVRVYAVGTGQAAYILPEQPVRIEGLAVHSSGKWVATVNNAGGLFVYPLGDKPRAQVMGLAVTAGEAPALGVAFAGDGTNLLTAGADGTVRLTGGPGDGGTPTGTLLRSYAGHAGRVTCVAAATDGKRFATGGADGTVRVWDTATGRAAYRFQASPGPAPPEGADGGVTAVALSPDGSAVAAGTADGAIKVWPLAPADSRVTTGAAAEVWAVAVSPDGKRYAAGGADKVVRVYATATGKLERTLAGHAAAVPTVAFAGDAALVTGGGDKLVKLWAIDAGTARDFTHHTSAVLAVATDPAGKLIVTGGADKGVVGCDAAGKKLWAWAGRSAVCALAVLPGAQQVAVGTADGGLAILDVSGPTPVVRATVSAHGAGTTGVVAHPAGGRLVTVGGNGAVRAWTLAADGVPVPTGRVDAPAKAAGPGAVGTAALSAVAYSADGRLVAAGGADGVVRVYDGPTLAERHALRGHTDWVTSVAFTPDGRSVLAASADKTVRRFDLPRPETSVGHTGAVEAVAVSPDGRRFATASADRTAKVFDRATGKLVVTLSGSPSPLAAIAFAGPDRVVTGGEDGRVRWWDIASGREVQSAAAAGRVFDLAANPATGKVAAAWLQPAERVVGVDVFDARGAAAGRVADKPGGTTGVGLAADAATAAFATAEGVHLWDLTTGARAGADWPLFAGPPAVHVALSADGHTLVGQDAAGVAKVAAVAARSAGESLPAGPGGGVVLDRTGGRFVTLGADGVVKLWDKMGKELRAWPLGTAARCVAVAVDGRTIVTGHGDGTTAVLEGP